MKRIQTLLIALSTLILIVGCGGTEEPSDAVSQMVSMQELPADDDIEGLYNLGIPRGWYKIKDPVLYTKYYRAQLLRQFGNLREVHIVADMELKQRQWIYPTREEYITYLEALYRLFPDPGTLASLENERQQKAEGEPFLLLYADAPAENIIARLEEIYQRKLTREEAIFEVALIKGDEATLQAFGLMKVKNQDPDAVADIDPARIINVFGPGGGFFKHFKEMQKKHDEEDPDEEDPDEE